MQTLTEVWCLAERTGEVLGELEESVGRNNASENQKNLED